MDLNFALRGGVAKDMLASQTLLSPPAPGPRSPTPGDLLTGGKGMSFDETVAHDDMMKPLTDHDLEVCSACALSER